MIKVTQSTLPPIEDYINEIQGIWDSRWLTNMGEKHRQLELELSAYLDASNISLFTNGHLALESVIAACELSGEVITTPFTFVSTTHAIVRAGLKPIFCDVDPNNYTLDTDQLEDLITDRTSAIIPVHVYGNICNVSEVDRIAQKHGLKVIYDAAHVFGATVDGTGVTNFGDASMFSFHATKVFHTIEGGAVTYRDERLKEKLEALKNFGITGPESVEHVGYNAKMNEFQAAMGICNLRCVDGEIAKRKRVTEWYFEHLDSVSGIRLSYLQKGVKSNYAYLPVVFDGYRYNRDEIFEMLKKNNIFARKYFYPLTSDLTCYKGRLNPGNTPVAKHIAENVLTLPLYADLAMEDVDRICRIILQ